ncbi:ABC transporter ATP-binding protein [Oscillospiraceae bacterium WX1]
MLEAVGLRKSYNKQTVLKDVTFSLARGRILGILGPNGAGKTTLMKILALIARPDAGTLKLAGRDAIAERRRVLPGIGYVPQDVALFEELTVRDNLMCWSSKPFGKARAQAERLIDELCLSSFALKPVSALSGGMKRRVNLAVAMLDEPALLILDEPLVGVDIEQRRQIASVLKKLSQDGVTQIIASHHIDEMMPLADDIMVMKDGAILFRGPAGALFDRRNSSGAAVTLEEVVLDILHSKFKGECAQ